MSSDATIQIKNGVRLEPIVRDDDLRPAFAATIHDPLWLLNRQLEFGELDFEDAGTPVHVAIGAVSASITGWRGQDANGPIHTVNHPLDPLDTTPALHQLNTLEKARLGRAILLGMEPATRSAILQRFPLEPAEGDEIPATVFTDSVPDGAAVLAAIRGKDTDPVASATVLGVVSLTDSELKRLTMLASATERQAQKDTPTWSTRLLRYKATFVTDNGAELPLQPRIGPWTGLDWYDIDLGKRPIATPAAPPVPVNRLPIRAHVSGAPSQRFWELEDRVLSPILRAAHQTPALAALQEYVIQVGDDWWTVPLPRKVGSLISVPYLLATDTFGRTANLAPGAVPAIFASQDGQTQKRQWPSIQVPQGLRRERSRILLLSDESANLIWLHNPQSPLPPNEPSGALHELPSTYRIARNVTDAYLPVIDSEEGASLYMQSTRRLFGRFSASVAGPPTANVGPLTEVELYSPLQVIQSENVGVLANGRRTRSRTLHVQASGPAASSPVFWDGLTAP